MLHKDKNIKLLALTGTSLSMYSNIFSFIFTLLKLFNFANIDDFSILLFITWIYNMLMATFIGFDSNKHVIWKLSGTYMILFLFSPLFMLLGNFLVSVAYYGYEIALFSILNLFGLFSISICGFFMNYFIYASIKGIKSLKNRHKEKRSKSLKRRITCKIFLITGFLFSLSLINGSSNYGAGVLAAAAQVSLGLSFAFAAFLLILLKTHLDKIRLIFYSAIGIFVIVSCLLPLITQNFALNQANSEFISAFGSEWESKINSVKSYFLEEPYSISKYLLGENPKQCIIKRDILYYEGDGIKLYFDAYIPSSENLPGNHSVLISIHGGGWALADKGFTNKIQNNKYFAAQGYVVFDIQYGLRNSLPFGLITPDNVKGNFSIDDMIKHIGIFTKYLANNSLTFNANLNSVFITGGSSGGHLACAITFAYNHPLYKSLFSQDLAIKGLIPLYPANGIATSILNIPGSSDLVQPEYLVNNSSPPCLLIHGTSDGIVDPSISLSLKKRYLSFNNTKIARILLPFAGHVLDYYYPGFFNQACLYFMERFLYIFK